MKIIGKLCYHNRQINYCGMKPLKKVPHNYLKHIQGVDCLKKHYKRSHISAFTTQRKII